MLDSYPSQHRELADHSGQRKAVEDAAETVAHHYMPSQHSGPPVAGTSHVAPAAQQQQGITLF